MHTKNLLINNGRHRQTVKTVSKRLPQLNIVPSLTFVIETINPVNAGTFVITSQDKEILRVFYFVCQDQCDRF